MGLRAWTSLAGLVALLLLLGGCVWVGPPLYDASRAQTPLVPGRYRAVVNGEPMESRITIAGSTTFISDENTPVPVLLVPLAMGERKLWIIQTDPVSERGDEYVYGVLERTSGGWLFEPSIECGPTEAVVRAAGGVIKPSEHRGSDGETMQGPSACVFNTTAVLETAMRDLLTERVPRQTLTRLGD